MFVILFLLLSSISSFHNSFDAQTNQIIELDNKEDNFNSENDKNAPINHIPILNSNGNFILYFEDNTYKDNALKLLDEKIIIKQFKYIPSLVVSYLDDSMYDLEGLKSITEDIAFSKAESQNQLVLKNQFGIRNAFTLRETSKMIGADILKNKYNLSGEGVSIAVLDTGLNFSLGGFGDNIFTHVVSDLEIEGLNDLDGHGTHVAGIIGSSGSYNINGNFQLTDSDGIAPNSIIHSIKVLNENGTGDNSWIIEGIEKAIELNVDIISLSLSTVIYEGLNDPMQAIIDLAVENGIIVIAASGNTGPIGSGIGIPAALNNVISVGASFPYSETEWELWTYSGIGPAINFSGADFIAPGARIVSVNARDGSISELSGTSMATPHVSGGVALLKEAFPDATNIQILEALYGSCELSSNSGGLIDQVEAQGRGQINLGVAYSILNETINSNSHFEMSITPNIVQDRNYVYHHRLIGENKTLPFYAYSSRELTVIPVINDNMTYGVNFYLPDQILIEKGHNLIEIVFEINIQNIEFIYGEVEFYDLDTNTKIPNMTIYFDSKARLRLSKVLFDTSHDLDTIGNYFGNHGPEGQFSQMAKSLEYNGHVIHKSENRLITEELLSEYNVLVIANPDMGYQEEEVLAIRNFVEKDGNSIFMIISGGLLSAEGDPSYGRFSKNSLNEILENTGISIFSETENDINLKPCSYEYLSYDMRIDLCKDTAVMSEEQEIFSKNINYAHYGPELKLIQNENVNTQEVAMVGDKIVAASALFDNNGRIIVFSSQLPFDNTGVLYDYSGPHSAESNENILNEGIDWLIEPKQSQTKIMVNDIEGHEFEIDMYEQVTIKIEFYDQVGGKLFLGDFINFTLEEDLSKPYPFIFQPGTSTYDLIFNYGAIAQEIDLNFYYYFKTNDSIASDTHFELSIKLKNYMSQSQLQQISFIFLVGMLTSWILIIKNEN
tara:strand:- start:3591 stop:6443 length:2853 start_codon:yes stop_codon:yes gene_type:complete